MTRNLFKNLIMKIERVGVQFLFLNFQKNLPILNLTFRVEYQGVGSMNTSCICKDGGFILYNDFSVTHFIRLTSLQLE